MSEEYDLMADLDSIHESTKVYDDPTEAREAFKKAPFGWPGGKMKSLAKILPLLPYRSGYIEPFGGSGVVLLNRGVSKLECLNDRYSGITDFYRVLRDETLLQQLIDRLDLTVHSREEFNWCKDTWITISDPVERAARWYYSVIFSFGGLGRNFGRATKKISNLSSKMRERLTEFPQIHTRLRNVTIENQDWRMILKDYDHESHVFYIDPPYIGAYNKTYKHEPSIEEHRELIARIQEMKAFVALSGYKNAIYDSVKWDGRHTWEVNVTIQPLGANHETNHKSENAVGHQERGMAEEVLWIKESV